MNKFAETLGLKYDKNGEIAKNGQLDDSLLKELNNINYYSLAAPKSLGTEWLEKQFFPLIPKELSPEKKIRTITEHIAIQISAVLNDQQLNSVFITGGGAHNNFLIECLKQYFSGNVIVPESKLIDFKEAIVFAFLGARYLRNESTTISSVTGAKLSLCTGVYHRI